MRPERDTGALHDMLAYAREAAALVARHQRKDLDTDRILYLALQRLVEIIGEAAARIPSTTRDELPQIPWRAVIGMRNRLIHGYDVVEPDVLWDTVILDLPPLLETLAEALKDD